MYMDMDMDMDIHAAAFHGDLDTDEWTHMQSSTQRWMLLLVPPTHAVGPSCLLYRWRLCGARKIYLLTVRPPGAGAVLRDWGHRTAVTK